MPKVDVTGELYGGKGRFSEFSGLFNSNDVENSKWKSVKFMVFDVVESSLKCQPFVTRLQSLSLHSSNVEVVKVTLCTSVADLDSEFRRIVDSGGEGIMLRKNSAYKAGRTSDMLKYKKFETTEGKVVGYTRGTGQFSSAEFVGSVKFVNRNGHAFKCVPPDRRNPPPVGTIVEVKCIELTALGVPRHPSWIRIRTNVTW